MNTSAAGVLDEIHELWFEIVLAVVRGGMWPEIVLGRVAVLSGLGRPFADAITARYSAYVDEILARSSA